MENKPQTDREILTEMQEAIKQLQDSQRESAASVAVSQRSIAKKQRLSLRTLYKWRIPLVVLLLIGLLISGYIVTQSIFAGETLEQTNATFVEDMQALSTLTTAKSQIKTVIEQSDNKFLGKEIGVNFPGTRRDLLLIVPSTVLAGVDLTKMKAGDISLDQEAKTATIVLPKATILEEPTLHLKDIQLFSVEGLFRSEVNWDEGFTLAAEAQELAKQEAIRQGILDTANEQAITVVTQWFMKAGFNPIVSFK